MVQRAKILKDKQVELLVKMPGIMQKLTFKVEKVPFGKVSYPQLATERIVPIPELLRIAEECKLPVKASNATVFPQGTTASSFIDL